MKQSTNDKKKKQEQVKEILLMPIVCNKSIKGTVRRENLIYTGQKYCNGTDEDMSYFAVGFYEIIYRNILKNENNHRSILNKDKYFFDINFAGDTMNSFNTISKEYTKNSSDWPDYLWKYFEGYHCLANFWIVPMHVGRTSSHTPKELRVVSKSKNGINDYMDKFLNDYKKNESKYKELYKDYFSEFQDFNDFATQHFLLESYYILEKEEIEEYSNSSNHTLEEIISSMKSKIETRANCISKSESDLDFGDSKKVLWKALWKYFYTLKLIQ